MLITAAAINLAILIVLVSLQLIWGWRFLRLFPPQSVRVVNEQELPDVVVLLPIRGADPSLAIFNVLPDVRTGCSFDCRLERGCDTRCLPHRDDARCTIASYCPTVGTRRHRSRGSAMRFAAEPSGPDVPGTNRPNRLWPCLRSEQMSRSEARRPLEFSSSFSFILLSFSFADPSWIRSSPV